MTRACPIFPAPVVLPAWPVSFDGWLDTPETWALIADERSRLAQEAYARGEPYPSFPIYKSTRMD